MPTYDPIASLNPYGGTPTGFSVEPAALPGTSGYYNAPPPIAANTSAPAPTYAPQVSAPVAQPSMNGFQQFGHAVLPRIPAWNVANTIAHLFNGTLGQHGVAPSVLGKLGQMLAGNPTGAPRATAVSPGNGPAASPPSFPIFGGGFSPIPGEQTIAGGGAPQSIDPRTGQPVYDPLGYGNFPNNPPVSTAGTPGQIAGNAQAGFQADFAKMQAMAGKNFNRPDEPFHIGVRPQNMLGYRQPSAVSAYQRAFPMGSTLQDITNFTRQVATGAIPTFQQFTGQPAYVPPSGAPMQDMIPGATTGTRIYV